MSGIPDEVLDYMDLLRAEGEGFGSFNEDCHPIPRNARESLRKQFETCSQSEDKSPCDKAA